MKQHQLDLLPESLRDRSRSGVMTGKLITVMIIVLAFLVLATVHSSMRLSDARGRLNQARSSAEQAEQAFALLEQASERLADSEQRIQQYRRVSLQIPLTRLMATIINDLPESMTLESIQCELTPLSGSVVRGGQDHHSTDPIHLDAELSGFAGSDEDIATLVSALDASDPFTEVNWDMSRHRMIRDEPAREFRVSFRIRMDLPYEVSTREYTAVEDRDEH
ncbi:MAG: hypothetical protein CMJ32_10450 [Phycisphaerae bacterium]|nr:hypothetical protein [Phycisphaerae bacterium]